MSHERIVCPVDRETTARKEENEMAFPPDIRSRVVRYRLNTIAGSMRVTLRIEDSAEMTHITIVSRNRIMVSAGVISTGSAES